MFFGASLVMGYSAIKSFSKSFKIQKAILHHSVLGLDYSGYAHPQESDAAWVAWAKRTEEAQVSTLSEETLPTPTQWMVDNIGKVADTTPYSYGFRVFPRGSHIHAYHSYDDNSVANELQIRNPRLNAINHQTRRFILKLIYTFFNPSWDNVMRLPGYFELHPERTLPPFNEVSALLELGRHLNDIEGQFYSFSETLFKEAWQGEQVFWGNTVDKLEDFFMYIQVLTQGQVNSGLKAIEDYRRDMGYYTRRTTAGRVEWDLARDLQQAVSRQLGRWISLRELAIMFRGRDGIGIPNDDSFFIRRMGSNRQKFRKDSIGDLMLWIDNPIIWSHKSQEMTIQLSGDNYNLAKQSILLYNSRVYNSKNVYVVNEEASNVKSLSITNTLLLAYSKHPFINRNF